MFFVNHQTHYWPKAKGNHLGVIRTPGYENYIFEPLIFRGDVSFGGSDVENENGVIKVNLPKRQNNTSIILTHRKS